MSTFEETQETITLHGLGFIQVKLDGDQRLHVWHPELPRRRCFAHSAIHNHRFGFTSHVLVGKQINHEIAVTRAPRDVSEPMTHVAYLHEGPRGPHGGRPWLNNGLVRAIEPGCAGRVPAGHSYSMAPYAFHWTEPGGDGCVATLMKKERRPGGGVDHGALSLCEIGVEPDAAFDRFQWSEARLWSVVLDVLGAGGVRDVYEALRDQFSAPAVSS